MGANRSADSQSSGCPQGDIKEQLATNNPFKLSNLVKPMLREAFELRHRESEDDDEWDF